MNNFIRIILSYIIFSGILVMATILPDDIKIKIGMGYNTNFFNFSDYEINDSYYNILILGDSDTFDSQVIRYSLGFSNHLKVIPIKFDVDIGFTDYTQSINKTSFYSSFIVSHRLGNYNWIKFGYKNIPKNYLRMYKDRDQVDSPILSADYQYEKVFSSISYPINSKIWFKAQYSRASMYFNPYFTEFDLIQDEIYIKVYNILYKAIKIAPFVKVTSAKNNTFNSGLISNNIDRSYLEYNLGTDFHSFLFIFYDEIKTTLSCKFREYVSKDLVDILHNNRSHIQFELIQKINKNVNDNFGISFYYKYVNRSTDGSTEYVEELKSYKNFEIGIDLLLNFTDKLYEISY